MQRVSCVVLVIVGLATCSPVSGDTGGTPACTASLACPWKAGIEMPLAIRETSAAKDLQGRMYVAGGTAYDQILPDNRVMRFSECLSSWSYVASMQTARGATSLASDSQGRIYAISGMTGSANSAITTNTVERYDPATDSWTYVASLAMGRYAARAVSDSQGRIIVAGGLQAGTGPGRELNSVQMYDPATDAWSSLPDLPRTLAGFGFAIDAQDQIYVVGGYSYPAGYSDATWRLDMGQPASGWTQLASISSSRCVAAAAIDCQGYLYAIAGYEGGVSFVSAVERFDPVAGTWGSYCSVSQGLTSSSALRADSGRIYLFGGDHMMSGTSRVEYLDTDSDQDGVPDSDDNCPNTPSGEPADAKGCSCTQRDADDDGVNDCNDNCPDTPLCATVDSDGCPADGDGDGVFDGCDECPDSPLGSWVDTIRGCPTSRADLDRDGDVDQVDFGIFQQCSSGPGVLADPNCAD